MKRCMQWMRSMVFGLIMLLGAYAGLTGASDAPGAFSYDPYALVPKGERVMAWADQQAARMKEVLPVKMAVQSVDRDTVED